MQDCEDGLCGDEVERLLPLKVDRKKKEGGVLRNTYLLLVVKRCEVVQGLEETRRWEPGVQSELMGLGRRGEPGLHLNVHHV